jgi:hypothetical protein
VTKKKILGANYALAALLPFSNSSISSPTLGAIGGGGGFSDSFYQPLTLVNAQKLLYICGEIV